MTRTATPETAQPPRYVLGASGGTDGALQIPGAATGVPEAVRAASDANERAVADHRQAMAEWRAAKEALRAAPAVDAAGDRAAVAAGKPLPEAKVTPAAAEAFALADRRMQATKSECEESAILLARAVAAARPEWLPVAEETVEATKAEAVAQLDQLAGLCDRLRAERGVAAALKTWPLQGSLVNIGFRDGEDLDRAEELRAAAAEKIRNSDHIGGTGRHNVPREANFLIGALRVLIDG